jgi:hypothetical protein
MDAGLICTEDVTELTRFLTSSDAQIFVTFFEEAFPGVVLTQHNVLSQVQFDEPAFRNVVPDAIQTSLAKSLPGCMKDVWYENQLCETLRQLRSPEELCHLAEKSLAHILLKGFVPSKSLVSTS